MKKRKQILQWCGLLLLTRCAPLLVLFLLFTSCALFTASFSPIKATYKKNLSLSQIADELSLRTVEVDTLWARTKMIISGEKIKGKKYFHATLLFRKPDNVRLRADRLYRTIFQIAARAEWVAVYFDRERDLYVGTIADLKETDTRLILSRPAEFVKALFVESTLRKLIISGKTDEVASGPSHYTIRAAEEKRSFLFQVRKKDLLVDRVSVIIGGDDDSRSIEVHYKRYKKFDDFVLPAELEVSSPDVNQKVEIKVSDYKMNPELSEQVFTFAEIKPRHVLPLKELFNDTGEW